MMQGFRSRALNSMQPVYRLAAAKSNMAAESTFRSPQVANLWCHQRRDLSSDTLQYGIKVKDGMQISDPVQRVLSLDSASRRQRTQIAKQKAIREWARHPGDTGSPEAQIAALTTRINALNDHVKKEHKKDHVTKRGYTKLMTTRRKMLQYLKRKDFEIYKKVALETGLR